MADIRETLAQAMVKHLRPGTAAKYRDAVKALTNLRPMAWQLTYRGRADVLRRADRDYLAWSDAQVTQIGPAIVAEGDDDAKLAWVQ